MTMQYPVTIEFLGTPGAGTTSLIEGLKWQFMHSSSMSSLRGVTMEDTSKLLPTGIFKKGSKEENRWIDVSTAKKLLEFQEHKKSGRYDIAFIDKGYVNSCFLDYFFEYRGQAISSGISYKNMGIVPPDFAVVLVCTPDQSIKRGETRYTREGLCMYNKALKEFFYTQMPCRNYLLETTHLSKREMVSKIYKVITKELP